MLYPLKDSNFGNDISSERSKQMIWGEKKVKNKTKKTPVKPVEAVLFSVGMLLLFIVKT